LFFLGVCVVFGVFFLNKIFHKSRQQTETLPEIMGLLMKTEMDISFSSLSLTRRLFNHKNYFSSYTIWI